MRSTHAHNKWSAFHLGTPVTTLRSRNSCRAKASNRILFAAKSIQKAGEQPNSVETNRHTRDTHGPPDQVDEREVAHRDSDPSHLSRSDADDPQDETEGTWEPQGS